MSQISQVLAALGLPPLPEPLPVAVVDSHTHLDATTAFSGLLVADSLAAAARAGVDQVVQIGCDAESSQWAADCALQNPQVVAAVAVHPNDAARHPDGLAAGIEVIDTLAGSGPHVRAVGETGLDHYRTTDEAGHAVQRASFADHIQIARAHGLTLVIHDRDAHAQVLDVLDAEGLPDRVIMHCFSGDADFARACLDRGAWLSFPGTVTFNANRALREALLVTPLDRLLVETDAPYLTPVPHRGRPNAPYLIGHTVRFLAATRGEDLAEVCAALTANAFAAYGGPWGES